MVVVVVDVELVVVEVVEDVVELVVAGCVVVVVASVVVAAAVVLATSSESPRLAEEAWLHADANRHAAMTHAARHDFTACTLQTGRAAVASPRTHSVG